MDNSSNISSPIFSPLWFRKIAMEILGNDDVILERESPCKCIITVKCDDDKKFNKFKEAIKKDSPTITTTVIIRREYIFLQDI